MAAAWAFVRLSRPHFLLGGGLLFALGAVAAPALDPIGYFLGQLMVSAAQITAHYVNEYADLEADRRVVHRTLFSGGSGVLAGGLLRPAVALRAAWVSSAIALVAALALVGRSPAAAVLGVVALAISWSYSMPPVRLLGTGWGETATSLLVAGAVPLVGSLAQGATRSTALWWAISILVPIHLAMMLLFELPDLGSDAGSGKRVLAVRLGRRRTRRLIDLLFVLAGVLAVTAGALGGIPAAAAAGALVGAPTALVARKATARGRSSLSTVAAVATLVLAVTGLAVGLSG